MWENNSNVVNVVLGVFGAKSGAKKAFNTRYLQKKEKNRRVIGSPRSDSC